MTDREKMLMTLAGQVANGLLANGDHKALSGEMGKEAIDGACIIMQAVDEEIIRINNNAEVVKDALGPRDDKESGEAAYYRKKEDDARIIRKVLTKKQSEVMSLQDQIRQLKKQLEMAEYVGD